MPQYDAVEKFDGGPAFPALGIRPGYGRGRIGTDGFYEEHEPGMTLRDYFAAVALQGIIAAQAGTQPEDEPTIPGCARCAYAHADAMLAERDGKAVTA